MNIYNLNIKKALFYTHFVDIHIEIVVGVKFIALKIVVTYFDYIKIYFKSF